MNNAKISGIDALVEFGERGLARHSAIELGEEALDALVEAKSLMIRLDDDLPDEANRIECIRQIMVYRLQTHAASLTLFEGLAPNQRLNGSKQNEVVSTAGCTDVLSAGCTTWPSAALKQM